MCDCACPACRTWSFRDCNQHIYLMPSYNRCKLITVKMSRWVAIVILIVGIVCALYKNYFLEELQLQYECHWNATHQALTIVKLRRDLHECTNEYDALDKQWKECQTEREFDLNTAKWQYQDGFQQAVLLSVVIVVVVIILLLCVCLYFWHHRQEVAVAHLQQRYAILQ